MRATERLGSPLHETKAFMCSSLRQTLRHPPGRGLRPDGCPTDFRSSGPCRYGDGGRTVDHVFDEAQVSGQLGPAGCGAVTFTSVHGKPQDCGGQVAHVGLILNRTGRPPRWRVWLSFACSRHYNRLNAPRPLLERDRSVLAHWTEQRQLALAGSATNGGKGPARTGDGMGVDAAGRRASSGRATASVIATRSSAHFIDQVASDLRVYRHIRIGEQDRRRRRRRCTGSSSMGGGTGPAMTCVAVVGILLIFVLAVVVGIVDADLRALAAGRRRAPSLVGGRTPARRLPDGTAAVGKQALSGYSLDA